MPMLVPEYTLIERLTWEDYEWKVMHHLSPECQKRRICLVCEERIYPIRRNSMTGLEIITVFNEILDMRKLIILNTLKTCQRLRLWICVICIVEISYDMLHIQC